MYSPRSEYFSGTGAGLKQETGGKLQMSADYSGQDNVTDLKNLFLVELQKAESLLKFFKT